MALTGNQLVARIKRNLGQREWIGGGSMEDAALDRVNDTILEVASIPHHFRSLSRVYQATLVSDQPEYTLPSGTRTLYEVYIRYNERWQKLQERPYSQLMSREGQGNLGGVPAYYAVSGSALRFLPTPSTAYPVRVRVVLWPSPISGSEYQPLGDPWDLAIEAGATAKMFASLQEPADAALWEERYRERVSLCLSIEGHRPGLVMHPRELSKLVPSYYWLNPFGQGG